MSLRPGAHATRVVTGKLVDSAATCNRVEKDVQLGTKVKSMAFGGVIAFL